MKLITLHPEAEEENLRRSELHQAGNIHKRFGS